ncbi:MAG: GNAT family N-acetyltransferase [Planctomycetes bacterium]|nr:GNAT family N-acetyltransferase [Planctomycetota bacterium]
MQVTALDPARIAEFLRLARDLHAADPGWVPPLDGPLLLELTGRHAFGRYGRQRLLLCEDGAGRALGRVAAVVNPRLPGLGQVGHFEAVDDDEVARALLDAASAWLREQGAREVWGPMTGGAHRPHRFMTAGFERPPFLLEPRNPSSYPRLFERQGFRRAHTWRTWELPVDRLAAWTGRLRRGEHTLVALDAGDPAATLARLHPLLDRAWAGHPGYAPLDPEELAEGFAGLLAVMPARHVGVIVDGVGRDVGFGFMVPDWIDEVRALDGDAAGWGRWIAAGRPLPPRLVLHTFAFVPEARGTGAAGALLRHAAEQAQADGYREAIVALVTEELRALRRLGEPTREYALYSRPL